jgi:hypothetical protein
MVFHVTNYMRETNVWMIRKGRWILWGFCGFVPLYRNFYWDFLGRRVVWKDYLFGGSEEDKMHRAEQDRANWGFKPRYEPAYDFSLKRRKYDSQTREEQIKDHPRIVTGHSREMREGLASPKEVRTIVAIASEHNRQPGAFDYNVPQTFYSLFPEIEQETFITLGGSAAQRRV